MRSWGAESGNHSVQPASLRTFVLVTANPAGTRVCWAEDLQLFPSGSQQWVKAEGRLVLPGVGVRGATSPHLNCTYNVFLPP